MTALSNEIELYDFYTRIRRLMGYVENGVCGKWGMWKMGYVENGSDTNVLLFQDDATKSFFVKVGSVSFYGDTLKEAVDKAYNATWQGF